MSGTVDRSVSPGRLTTRAAGLEFRNPVLLPAGTAGYGRELADVADLHSLGALVTKAISVTPRNGAPAPRVAEFEGGMINAIGLANPGLDEVRATHLPWLATNAPGLRILANVVGNSVDEFATVVSGCETCTAPPDAFELNVSCPNVKEGGMEFGASTRTLTDLVRRVRSLTARPLFVKLSPSLPDIASTARAAVDAGADALTLVNTLPGLVIDIERRRPALGFGSGGVSGAALLPIGVLATWRVRQAVTVPLIGVGGIKSAEDALQYIVAGASLVGVGTAAMRDPRLPERIVRDLDRWCARHGISSIASLVGTLEWPT